MDERPLRGGGGNDDWVERVRAASDIVEIVQQTVPLRRVGRNLMGRCPFHEEKSASFSVSPERQFYHCFGCKAGGDVFKFVMETEKVGFLEAVELLSRRASIPIPERRMGDRGKRAPLLEALDAAATLSSGVKPLAATQYYTRYTQRLISAFTAQTAEGKLYDVDMRLRPSGQKGPVATQLSSFIDYQNTSAWTWEHLALTRARVLGPPTPLKLRIENNIRSVLTARREPAKLKADVADMRRLVEAEKGTDGIWNLKQVRGGQLDIEFIAQYLQLRHAAEHPSVLSTNTAEAFERLEQAGVLAADAAATLIAAVRLYDSLSQILRLCFDGPFLPEMAPSGLRKLLAAAAEVPDFVRLEAMLAASQQEVRALFAAFFD